MVCRNIFRCWRYLFSACTRQTETHLRVWFLSGFGRFFYPSDHVTREK
nr:MAG TPA: hypothetical protein [Caudoviricetes sp.]